MQKRLHVITQIYLIEKKCSLKILGACYMPVYMVTWIGFKILESYLIAIIFVKWSEISNLFLAILNVVLLRIEKSFKLISRFLFTHYTLI